MNYFSRSSRIIRAAILSSKKSEQATILRVWSVLCFPSSLSHRLCHDEDVEYDYPKFPVKPAKVQILEKLTTHYGYSEEEVENILALSPSLKLVHPRIIAKNAEYLKDCGLNKNVLAAFPWVLGYNAELTPSALRLVKNFHPDINVSIALLAISFKKLRNISYSGIKNSEVLPEGNRITWLSKHLKSDELLVSKTVAKHTFMLTMSLERIMLILDIFKAEGSIRLEDTVKDMSVFKNCPNKMKGRLKKVKDAGITYIKPWALHCPENVFERMVERKVMSRKFLGDFQNTKEYLKARLQCKDYTLDFIFDKVPQMKHISVMKVKKLLDYLYEVGYTPQDVCYLPRILTRSVSTVKSRVIELQSFHLNHPSLLILCKTRREYKELIDKLKESR